MRNLRQARMTQARVTPGRMVAESGGVTTRPPMTAKIFVAAPSATRPSSVRIRAS
jgi:hypothetical protein